ncbi:hypothetical protein CR513_29649, partial [Mucuna pruriens]
MTKILELLTRGVVANTTGAAQVTPNYSPGFTPPLNLNDPPMDYRMGGMRTLRSDKPQPRTIT